MAIVVHWFDAWHQDTLLFERNHVHGIHIASGSKSVDRQRDLCTLIMQGSIDILRNHSHARPPSYPQHGAHGKHVVHPRQRHHYARHSRNMEEYRRLRHSHRNERQLCVGHGKHRYGREQSHNLQYARDLFLPLFLSRSNGHDRDGGRPIALGLRAAARIAELQDDAHSTAHCVHSKERAVAIAFIK